MYRCAILTRVSQMPGPRRRFNEFAGTSLDRLSGISDGIFAVGQGTQISLLERSNRHYAWVQLGFLFAVTLVPFSTALLAHYPGLKVALVEYWLNIVLLGAMLLAGLEYGLRAHLFEETEQPDMARLMRGR